MRRLLALIWILLFAASGLAAQKAEAADLGDNLFLPR
jgi:hypothetical protein